jgi:hypothetical protein
MSSFPRLDRWPATAEKFLAVDARMRAAANDDIQDTGGGTASYELVVFEVCPRQNFGAGASVTASASICRMLLASARSSKFIRPKRR